jgi:hypothetical protein
VEQQTKREQELQAKYREAVFRLEEARLGRYRQLAINHVTRGRTDIQGGGQAGLVESGNVCSFGRIHLGEGLAGH